MSREAGFVVTMQFQRNAEPARVKKPVRTSPLRLIHVLAAVAAVGALSESPSFTASCSLGRRWTSARPKSSAPTRP